MWEKVCKSCAFFLQFFAEFCKPLRFFCIFLQFFTPPARLVDPPSLFELRRGRPGFALRATAWQDVGTAVNQSLVVSR